jgi:predicted nucleotidyltransferase
VAQFGTSPSHETRSEWTVRQISRGAYYYWHPPSILGIVNLGHPLSSLVTTLSGRVLEVLANTSHPLSGRHVLRLLRVEASQQGVQNALDELAAHGLVEQVAAGGSILNTLNREHILAPHIIGIVNLRNDLIDRLATIVSEEAPEASRAILFGSLARAGADEESDIDIAMVWPDERSHEAMGEDIAVRIVKLTGNACNLLHYTAEEFGTLAERAPELYDALESEGIDLIGALAR